MGNTRSVKWIIWEEEKWPQKAKDLTRPNLEAWCLKFNDVDYGELSLVRHRDFKTQLPLEGKRQWANGWFYSQRDRGERVRRRKRVKKVRKNTRVKDREQTQTRSIHPPCDHEMLLNNRNRWALSDLEGKSVILFSPWYKRLLFLLHCCSCCLPHLSNLMYFIRIHCI